MKVEEMEGVEEGDYKIACPKILGINFLKSSK